MKQKTSKQSARFSWRDFLKHRDIHSTPELLARLHILKRRIRQLRGAGLRVLLRKQSVGLHFDTTPCKQLN